MSATTRFPRTDGSLGCWHETVPTRVHGITLVVAVRAFLSRAGRRSNRTNRGASNRALCVPDRVVRHGHSRSLMAPRLAATAVGKQPIWLTATTLDGMNLDDLPRAEFAFPGPLRDRLVAAILSRAKTSTSGLVLGYERENEPLPRVGQVLAVVDSEDRRVATIELTEVRVVRLADMDLQHVLDEGEDEESVAKWRAEHERFWHSAEVRAELGDPNFTVNDDTLVLAQRFRLVHTAEDA